MQKSSSVTALLACAALAAFAGLAPKTSAQPNPTMTNVIPDSATGSIQGKIQSIHPSGRQVTIAPADGRQVSFVTAPNVRLNGFQQGDSVAAQYHRTVVFVVTPPGTAAPQGTETVGQLATTPGGIGSGGTQIVGRVTKIDSGRSFDIVNATGGGVYTIQVTDPTRIAMLGLLKVGDAVTVAVSPLTITSISECGFFGCS